MQVVLDTFRLGGRPSPYDEYCQPAKHKDREAEAERDPADRIEHIRPAVRNVPRADDAEGQCGQQIEHKQFEPVLVCPDLPEAVSEHQEHVVPIRFFFQQTAFIAVHLQKSTSIRVIGGFSSRYSVKL